MATFYIVRHGEPDYPSVGEWRKIPFGKEFAGLTLRGVRQIETAAAVLKKYSPEIILSSPYTRTMQGAAIMSRILDIPVIVEKDLHEWDADISHTIREDNALLALCQEHDLCHGIYPDGEKKLWESRTLVEERVLGVFSKYLKYDRVVVSGHAMMMQAVLRQEEPFEYGEVVVFESTDML